MDEDHYAINRAFWDERAPAHAGSADYAVQEIIADPTRLSDMIRFDLPRLGDVNGLRGIHLQCHIGTDTISLHRLGAAMTGLDFSAASIAIARRWATLAPLDEHAQIHLINALRREGQPVDALALHSSFVTRVREELDTTPSRAFLQLARTLDQSARTPPARSRPRPGPASTASTARRLRLGSAEVRWCSLTMRFWKGRFQPPPAGPAQ